MAVSAAAPVTVHRSPTLRAFLLFVVIFGGLFACELHILFYEASGVPVTTAGERPRVVGEVAGELTVAQTFGVQAGGFSGVTIEARPFAGTVDGDVVFTVTDVGEVQLQGGVLGHGPSREIARVTAQASAVVADRTYRVGFPPVEPSGGRQYRLDIAAPAVPAGKGIGLHATRDQGYLGGVLTVGGQEQWSDLVFEVHAERSTVFRRVEYLLRDKPAWLRSRWTLGTLIVLYNWALATFTWYMLFVEDEPGADAA
jgi:hypothetical protein